jgi:hypothetical protein
MDVDNWGFLLIMKYSSAYQHISIRIAIGTHYFFPIFRANKTQMKTSLLSIAFCLGLIPAFSQITIGSGDMPSAGDSIHVSIAVGVGAVDHTLTGANYTWDFSTLVPSAQQEYRYTTPSALPFNFLSSSAFVNPSPDSLPFIGNVPSNFTDYFKNSGSGFRQNGLSFDYAPLTTFSIPVIYTTSDYFFRFPLDYLNVDSSDAAYSINFPPLPYIGQTIHRENTVDGWGTLITPFGTFNTLRVVSAVLTTDTIGLDSVNGFSTPRPLVYQYKWMASGMKIPVLEVDAQILFGNEVVTNVVYQDSVRNTLPQVGINENSLSISNVAVYPNPATSDCYVSFMNSGLEPVGISIMDLSGREVRNFGKQTSIPGSHTQLLNLDGISGGTYLIKISSGEGSVTHRIIVAN